ncbi:hypothetical protein BJF85_22065 [Saccharomonospora sp. CUA-673]|uniref:hypothetical protein n=1 Tax=Saccharomonospora sp. CUA-673 TaxID=1904969 RepID=UPI00096882A5|nr:hypothetical protein [Saccharomonospora sp. CUA-673]OLT42743.1 hypothetical protein BJF85_22065 [Saccharomonospora sp. CUA-673]
MNPRSITARAVGIGVLCVAAMAVCLGLAWWQWDRFSSAAGSYQNLGYVLQWPLFGLFPLFMVWRWHVLSRRRPAEDGTSDDTASADMTATETAPEETASQPVTAGRGEPERPGPALAEQATSAPAPREPAPVRRSTGNPFGPRSGATHTATPGETGTGEPDAGDTQLAEYNRYLADLYARDQEVK